MIAETVSHYAIGERLGAGGMGVVYRARDKMLGREVALKFVAAHLAGSERFKERLLREARAISALSHSNVATIYEIGDSPEGLFLALEFLPGGTLRSKLEQLKSAGQSLSVSEAVQIAVAAGEGLAHAHRHGIVHRDIKPANLMFNADGIVKITDFGISKVADSADITQPGALVGTRCYMSPEQARGEEVDERSDIYSLGVVLREMLAGTETPGALLQVIDRATEADRNSRYQRVEDMLHDLRGLQHQTEEHTATMAAEPAPSSLRSRSLWAAAAILLLIIGATWLRYGGHSKPEPRPRVIAVLPFTNIGADDAFCSGLVETLTTSITQLERFHSALVVVPASEVRDQAVESPSAARRAFGVNYAITGSVQREAGRVRLTANLVDAGRLVQVGGRTIANRVEDLDGLQDQVVSVVAELLDVQLRPDQRALLRAGQTDVAGAYDSFVQARGYLDRYDKAGNLNRAIELLQQAIRLDPRYALAYAAMSEAKWRKYNETHDARLIQEARNVALQATSIDSRVCSAHVNLGIVYNIAGRYSDAIREYNEALQNDPLSVEALRSLAETYQASGNSGEAEKVYRRAVQLRPSDWYTHTLLGMFYYRCGRHADAEPAFRRVVELTPDNFLAFANLGSSLLVLNRFTEAEENFRKSISLRASARGYTGLAGALYGQKRYADAAALNERAAAMAPTSYTVWGNLADSYHWTPALKSKAPEAYRRALENVGRVLGGNPKDGFALSCRAVFRVKLGDAAQARRDVEAARGLAPGDARVLYHAVVVEELAGDRAGALESAARAVNAGYSPANLEADPDLAKLARDNRFQELKQNYWRQHGRSSN